MQIEPAMPLPHRVVLATTRLDEATAHLQSVLCRQRIDARTSHTPFRHNGAQLADVAINAIYWGRDVRIHSDASDDYILLVMTHGTSFVHSAAATLRLGPRQAFVFNPGDSAQLQLTAGQCNVTLRIPSSALRHFAAQHLGADDGRHLRFGRDRAAVAQPRGMARLVDAICAEIDSLPSSYLTPVVSRSLQHAVFGLLLTEFSHNLTSDAAPRGRRTGAVTVERAQRFMLEHARERISLAAIARAAGCSVRALQHAFRTRLGLAPHAFLTAARLELAHRELRYAAARARGVSEVALACGFTHVGRFAALYRERFGENPSTTYRLHQ